MGSTVRFLPATGPIMPRHLDWSWDCGEGFCLSSVFKVTGRVVFVETLNKPRPATFFDLLQDLAALLRSSSPCSATADIWRGKRSSRLIGSLRAGAQFWDLTRLRVKSLKPPH